MDKVVNQSRKNNIPSQTSLLKKYFASKIIKAYFLSVVIAFVLLDSAIILHIVFKYSHFPIYLIFVIFLLSSYQFIIYTLSIGFLSSIIWVINNIRLSGELQSLYNIGYDNTIVKSIFFKISLFLSLFLFLSFHFILPFTNRVAGVLLLKNISYMFEPKFIWKNSIEFPFLILSYEKLHNDELIGLRIVEWNTRGTLVISGKKGHFTRNLKSLTLQISNAKIKVIKNNKVMVNIRKSKYLYRMDLSTMISKFIKNIKENNSLNLVKKLNSPGSSALELKKTSYELGKRTALSVTPFTFYFLGLTLAFLIPTTSLLFSQIIALFIVFTSFYSVMVLSSKFTINTILFNYLLPFIPNIVLVLVSFTLFVVCIKLKK
ncbi:MAG: LptF/LptG family permease [Planctomycetota bacterium]